MSPTIPPTARTAGDRTRGEPQRAAARRVADRVGRQVLQRLLQAIAIEKDVDGFNWANLGALVDGHPKLAPCTPLAVMSMLERARIPVEGRHAVVIGRSSIVGKPVALMLIARGASVLVMERGRTIIILPDRGVDLGVVAPEDRIVVNRVMTGTVPSWHARVIAGDSTPA